MSKRDITRFRLMSTLDTPLILVMPSPVISSGVSIRVASALASVKAALKSVSVVPAAAMVPSALVVTFVSVLRVCMPASL